ncbi:MAG: putative peptide zinc metalloprotease protein [Actinomycetota bacterium]|jgi:putative peptide zinc metalloprotease protein|nr:putative peptide zinc metalloprotease protein [Actinomycetota bacterium]
MGEVAPSSPDETRADQARTVVLDATPAEESGPTSGASQGAAPQLTDGIELLGEYEGSGFKEPRYLVKRTDGEMVQLTELLYLIVESIDGSKGLDDIAQRVSEKYGKKVSADNVRQLIETSLQRDGIVAGAGGAQPAAEKADPLLALKLKTTLLPERAVNFFAALLRPLFWPPLILAVVAGLVALDIWYFGVHGVGKGLRELIYQPLVMLMLYGLLILSVGWHELGHATATRYGGARPGKIGFGIYVVWPAFYTDVTDALRLGKGGRVRTDLGGVYFNAIFALATAGVYFLTGFEPLLILVMIQHLLIFYQFLPFMRLDGYHVISDLTGIPDLFARIRPTLAGMIPFKKSPKEVTELKPWARIVVTVWVLSVVPVLFYLFGMMILSAPRVLATAWDSFFIQKSNVAKDLDGGSTAQAAVHGLQVAFIVLPVLGMSVTFTRVTKRIATGFWNFTKGHPFRRVALGAVGLTAIAGVAYLLIPNGEYKPIQPGEDWTFANSIEAASDVTSGRPALTEDRETELNARFFSDTGEDPLTAEEESTATDTSDTSDQPAVVPAPDGTPPADESTPEPTPTPEETAVTPEPTPTP